MATQQYYCTIIAGCFSHVFSRKETFSRPTAQHDRITTVYHGSSRGPRSVPSCAGNAHSREHAGPLENDIVARVRLVVSKRYAKEEKIEK